MRRSRGDSRPLRPYGSWGIYSVRTPDPTETRHKLPASVWPELVERSKTCSLRHLAREYDASHEAVRSALRAASAMAGP